MRGYVDGMALTKRSTGGERPAAVRWWYAAALLLAALTAGLELAHVLGWAHLAEIYALLPNSLSVGHGTIGLVTCVGAIVATAALVWLVRRNRRLAAPTATAFALQVIALTSLLALIVPVDVRLRALPPGTAPPDLAVLRDRWEYTHGAGFVLFAVAFALLLVALMRAVDPGLGAAGHRAERHRGNSDPLS